MFCSNCGTQLPDDANYCLKCGKSQKGKTQSKETKWETCEIAWTIVKQAGFLSNSDFQWWAKAIGSGGGYNAGNSPVFTGVADSIPTEFWENKYDKARESLNVLINQLYNDGWEFVSTYGDQFYQVRFRRRVE